MAASATTASDRVRALNDQLRQHRIGGKVVTTTGLSALGPDFVRQAMQAVASFDAFTPDNDRYGEHDFGQVQIKGQSVLFKIDYYDLTLIAHSPDPADPTVTRRIMTLMLPEEY